MRHNVLAVANPTLASQLVDPAQANKLTSMSKKQVSWFCSEGHTWQARVYSRSAGARCPYCVGRLMLPGETDFATCYPALVSQLVAAYSPVSSCSNVKVGWRCEKGHEWDASFANRAKGHGCPYCSGRRAIPGETDLATTHPHLAAQLVDQPLAGTLLPRSGKRVLWRCDKNHTWLATPGDRVSRSRGCPYCFGRLAIPGETDLATTHPHLAAQLVDQKLATVLRRGSIRAVDWKCDEGHVWSTTPNRRSRPDTPTACPTCAKTGFDQASPAVHYWLQHRAGLLKIGISGAVSFPGRMAHFRRFGWQHVADIAFTVGSVARHSEKQLLQTVKGVVGSAPLPDLITEVRGEESGGVTEMFSRSEAVLAAVAKHFNVPPPRLTQVAI